MTKEQEKAIERLNRVKTIKVLYTKTFAMTTEQLKVIQADIETALNMLKERDEEIENNKKKNKELSNQILNFYKEQDNYNARIEKKNTEIAKKDNELKKKDKIIDLMAEFLGERDLRYYKNETDGEILGIIRKYNKEDWKQYFEKKATNNG